MGIICAAIAILILVICLCAKSCNSSSSRNNAYNLARTYAEQGEYDRALSVLDKLLLKNGNDPTALEMLQQIIEMKKAADEGRAVPEVSGVTSVNINTDGITDAMQDSMAQVKNALAESNRQAEENRKTMENLVKIQAENSAAEKRRQEAAAAEAAEKRKAEAAAEAQRKAAEEKRKAEE